MMIDMNMPHNILVTDEGMTCYVIPRKFDMLIEKVPFYTSFESLCGFVKYKTKQSFSQATDEQFMQMMSEKVSLSNTEFRDFRDKVIQKFSAEYECQTFDLEDAMQGLKV